MGGATVIITHRHLWKAGHPFRFTLLVRSAPALLPTWRPDYGLALTLMEASEA